MTTLRESLLVTYSSNPNKERHKFTNIDTINIILIISIIYLSFMLLDYYGVFASSDNVFRMRLDSGAFRDIGVTTPLVQWYTSMLAKFFQTVLPIVSNTSAAVVVLSLIATVFYYLAQEYFNEVYILKKMHKQSKAQAQSQGGGKFSLKNIGFIKEKNWFKVHIVPNCRAYAFNGADGEQMTVSDFFKENGVKCIIVFTFCIVIGDQAMIDLFYQGGEIGAYFVRKLARDYDYVEMIDNIITIGSDYKPQWDTTQIEGRNKDRVFQAVYKKLKIGTKTPATSSTEFKANMGQRLEAMIEDPNGPFKDVVWSHKSFIVSAEYLSTSIGGANSANRIYLPVTDFGFNPVDNIMTGYVIVYVTSEEERFGTSVITTTFQHAWKNISDTSATIDLTLLGLKIPKDATISGYTGTAYIMYNNNNIDTVELSGSGETITFSIPSVSGTTPKSIRIPDLKISFSDGSSAKATNSVNYLYNNEKDNN